MLDALPADFGVNVAGRAPTVRMTREQAAAHARLANLPTTRHLQERRDAQIAAERSEKASRTRKLRGTPIRGASISLANSRPAK